MQDEATVSEKANRPSRASKPRLLAVVIVVVSMVALLFYFRKTYLAPDFMQQAIRLEPDFYEARLNLAYAYNKTGQPAMAEEQARWCLGINPREVAALRILALAARDQGDFEAAKQHLKTASQMEPLNLDCRILEADLLLYERKPQEAYERLRELYDSHQQTVRYLGALARAAASAGKREEARELHRRVAELLKQAK